MIEKQNDIIFSAEEIAVAIQQMAAKINQDYKGKDLVIISMLKGSLFFLADLCRAIQVPLQFDVIDIGKAIHSESENGILTVTRDITIPIEGKDVLILEEIVRSGLTTNYMIQIIQEKNPNSINLAALLVNPDQLLITLPLKYLGLEIDYTRVVGYGMDYQENFRNFPYVKKLDKNILQ